MVESLEESRRPASHIQRTVMFLSAMRHFAAELRDAGWTVRYRSIADEDHRGSIGEELAAAIEELAPERVEVIEPGDFRLGDMVRSSCEHAGCPVAFHEDPHFTCPLEEFRRWARGRKQLTMEYFYRERRRALGILMEGDEPVGGVWNLDQENRQSFRKAPSTPKPLRFEPDDITRRVIDQVRERLPDLPGRIESFRWPVTRAQAIEALDDFIAHRLPCFGDFQDAMWTGHDTLYHAMLSPAMNLKLLDPREVVEKAVAAYASGQAPLNAVEGFERQIIGWREFIRGIYFLKGPSYADCNALEHDGRLPAFYWTGRTDMVCMREALRSVLDHAYGHHIARLMVTGNFAMIAGVAPRAVADWYLGMYADGVAWVTDPNTLGMALHADGGVVGTKPYAASGQYIKRMSNYCKSCPYDPAKKHGDDACPFTVFYWDFLHRHRARFKNNRRMSLVLNNLDRLGEDDLQQVTVSARSLRAEFGIA